MSNPKYIVSTKIYMGPPMDKQLNETIEECERGDGLNWRLVNIVGPLLTRRGPDTFVGYFQGERAAEQPC